LSIGPFTGSKVINKVYKTIARDAILSTGGGEEKKSREDNAKSSKKNNGIIMKKKRGSGVAGLETL